MILGILDTLAFELFHLFHDDITNPVSYKPESDKLVTLIFTMQPGTVVNEATDNL